MTCEGKDLKSFSDDDLLAAKAYHETSALFKWADGDSEQLNLHNDLIKDLWGEIVRRTEADPVMIQIRKRMAEDNTS